MNARVGEWVTFTRDYREPGWRGRVVVSAGAKGMIVKVGMFGLSVDVLMFPTWEMAGRVDVTHLSPSGPPMQVREPVRLQPC